MKRVQVGTGFDETNPFPGDTWNELVGAAEKNVRDGKEPPPIPQGLAALPSTIRVKNTTTEHLPRYAILGCGDPLNKPSSGETKNGRELQRQLLTGVTPTTADHASKFVVMQAPVAKNSSAEGLRSGFTWVKVDVTDEAHTSAKIKDTDTEKLASASSGPAEIWWKESGTGTKWALVLLGGGRGTPTQLAMITGLAISGTSPHYTSPHDLTFTLPTSLSTAVAVYAVLLARDDNDVLLQVSNPGGDTLDDLRFVAWDVRREGLPAVGDIVRVWSDDGAPISVADAFYDPTDEGETEAARIIYCEPINAVEELRGLPDWDLAEDQVLVHSAGTKELAWIDAGEVGGTGEPGPPGADGDTVVPGYGIDTSGTGTVTIINDPTEWTGFVAAEFQFFVHDDDATLGTVTDPKWVTPSGYDDGEVQQFINNAGTLAAVPAYTVKSTEDDTTASHLHDAIKDNASYVSGQDAIVANETDGASATNQKERLFVDVSAISGWSSGTVQLLGHDASGNLKWDSVPNWLNTMTGYTFANDQSIGHDDSGATEWQDDGTCS